MANPQQSGASPALPGAARSPAQPAPRRRSRWLAIGLPIGLEVLVGLGVAVWFGGRWADAQGELCERDRSAVTAEALEQQYSTTDLTGYRPEGVNVVSSNGRTSGGARLVSRTPNGLDTTTVLPLEKDGEAWQPCP